MKSKQHTHNFILLRNRTVLYAQGKVEVINPKGGLTWDTLLLQKQQVSLFYFNDNFMFNGHTDCVTHNNPLEKELPVKIYF